MVSTSGSCASNPFKHISLPDTDMTELQVVAKTILDANLESYVEFEETDGCKIDQRKWKFVKSKDDMRVYLGRQQQRCTSDQGTDLTPDLQRLLCVGTTPGTLDDVMFGIVSPTFEVTRTNSAYLNDRTESVVLSTVILPTVTDPFRSVVVKWMELDVRVPFVKNRDYVYVESTGIIDLPSGERLGFHVMHSVDFPQAHGLPDRVRGKLSVCSFFREVGEESVSVYVMGMTDPMSNSVRRLVVPKFVKTLLSTLKYAHCGEMKKLNLALSERYNASKKTQGLESLDNNCTSCQKNLRVWRFGNIMKQRNTCKLCFRVVCSSCTIKRKLSFLSADSQLTQRKVSFCPSCVRDAVTTSAVEFSSKIAGESVSRVSRMPHKSTWSGDWGSTLDEELTPQV